MATELTSRLMILGLGVLLGYAVMLVPCASEGGTTGITIDLRDEKQVIHSFGASDAWTCQFVGEHWPIEKRNAIADLLFSREVDGKGNPKGIALSMWRFNIGAGSSEQDGAGRISSPWHRAECFLNKDGSYDWGKQKGQQWFLEAAHTRGVRYLLAFTNSPPVHLTYNGIAHSSGGRWTMNMRHGAMPSFADFLVKVADHFAKKGLCLDYISPVNEPQYVWDSDKQEGTPATNAEVAGLSRLIAVRLHEKGLSSQVVVPEAARLDYLWAYEGNPREVQVDAFWNASSSCFLGNLPNVAHVISAHSYFSTWPLSRQVETRERVSDCLRKVDPNLGFWQTEYCVMEANDEIGGGPGRDTGMNTALYVARVIHSDLTIANATHWSWWLAVSQADFKDGLIYIEGETPMTDGRVTASKTLWALGNFSRFVRPGMVRVGVSYDDNRSPLDAATSLMVSAYLDKKTKQLAIVAINPTTQAQGIRPAGKNLEVRGNAFATYTTSETCSLGRGTAPADRISIPSRSIVTLVGNIE